MMTYLDSSVLDINSEALGVTANILMHNAGLAVSDVIKERFHGKKIAFVCGNGNNGGDGFSAANNLSEEDVTILLLKPPENILSLTAQEYLSNLLCPTYDFDPNILNTYDVVIDCALGTGIKGDIKEPYIQYLKSLKSFKGTIISLDIPSGMGSNIVMIPDITITFHDIKKGMNGENSGEIIVKDIGIPADAYRYTGPGDVRRYPIPDKNSHKGTNGKLLLIGGGEYYGAPILSALGAIKVGVDLVKIATPSSCYELVSSHSPLFTTLELGGNFISSAHTQKLLDVAKENNAVLIGPGIGTCEETILAVNDFIDRCALPMVIDADGLSALGDNFKTNNKNIILTPHSKEFQKLGGGEVKDLASKLNVVILKKGQEDIISDGVNEKRNKTGNSAMTSGGTGDVLSGIVSGLLCKGMSTYESAYLGAYISGIAGDMAYEEKSYGLTANDIIEKIPTVLRNYLR